MKWLVASAVVAVLATPLSSMAMCFEEAGERYDVPASLLKIIALVESDMRPNATNVNADGSEDIGLMMINSGWLPQLAKFGIRRADLFEPCTSVMVGAWVLANNIEKLGYNWDAIGAYNARSRVKREIYADKIYKRGLKEGIIRG